MSVCDGFDGWDGNGIVHGAWISWVVVSCLAIAAY